MLERVLFTNLEFFAKRIQEYGLISVFEKIGFWALTLGDLVETLTPSPSKFMIHCPSCGGRIKIVKGYTKIKW